RALGNDIHRNLDVPLEGVRRLDSTVSISTGIRTGDTPQRDRARLIRNPPDVLITTPESLFLMLTSERAAKTLENVETVIVDQVNERAGEQMCRVHHGSVSREARSEVEEMLKRGELPALISTSSMELGIDVGAIDLVVQIESPKTATAGLQRVGRAGHLVGETATGRIIPKYRPDLLDAAVVASRMLRREIEEVHIPHGCLD